MPLTLKHNDSVVDLDAAACELGTLTQSFLGPWTLTLRRAIAFDAATDWECEDTIELLRDGTAVFRGTIKSAERIASPEAEHVVYTCVGLREAAAGVPFQRTVGGTATARVVYNCPAEETIEESGYVAIDGTASTAGEILEDILDAAAAALEDIIGDGTPGSGYESSETAALAMVPMKVVLNGLSVEEAIAAVLRHAPDFGWYIDPASRTARFIDFRTLTAKDVPGVGEAVLRHELDFSTAGCYSACTVQGTYELVDVSETLTPAWDSELEADWTSEKCAKFPDTYGLVWRAFATSEPASVGGALMPQRCAGNGDMLVLVTVEQTLTSKTCTVAATAYDDTRLLLNSWARQWSNAEQKHEAAMVRARFTYRKGRISGRYPATGHAGTAHTRRGLARELFLINEERGKKSVKAPVHTVVNTTTFRTYYQAFTPGELAGATLEFNGDGVEHTVAGNAQGTVVLTEAPETPIEVGDTCVITIQDDTKKEFEGNTLSILEKYAKETLERVMDERFVGHVPLAGLDWTLALGQKINFTETDDSFLSTLGATLIAVERDLAAEHTTLRLTSDRALGGSVTWDELDHQRRRDQAVDENSIQIRRLWRRLRSRHSPDGSVGDPHEEDEDGPYRGDGTWTQIVGKEIEHIGPGPTDETIGAEGQYIQWIKLDARGHVVDAAAGTFS